jgi:peptide/nickel transport system ATP-binding protein
MSAAPIHNPRLRNRERRIRLEGEVADPAHPPTGCYFYRRCRYANERCANDQPTLRLIESAAETHEHYAAYHFSEELSLRGVIGEGRMAGD